MVVHIGGARGPESSARDRTAAHPCYTCLVSTTTVRLDDDDEAILDELAPRYGGRSSAIRQALRELAVTHHRQDALRSFLTAWGASDGPPDEATVAAMADRYGL